jgi:hypothetical protein
MPVLQFAIVKPIHLAIQINPIFMRPTEKSPMMYFYRELLIIRP